MADDAQYESISAEDLGLPLGARMPLRFCPGHVWSPLVISFPHVGLTWPHDLRPKPQADFARNADYEVQTLYAEANTLGVATIEAVYSRLVVDLNRAADDVSSVVVPDHPAPRPRRRPGVPMSDEAHNDHGHRLDRPGRGVVWASAVGNVRILDAPLRFNEFRRRIERYHEPYYRALSLLLERRRRRFGFAVLLDAHSMPSSVGVDLVLGTLGGNSCAPELERRAMGALRGDEPGTLTVRLNEPYRGGEVVRRFGRPHEGFHALQLEVSRRLYMDEATNALWAHPTSSDLVIPRLDAHDLDPDLQPASGAAYTHADAAGLSAALSKPLSEPFSDNGPKGPSKRTHPFGAARRASPGDAGGAFGHATIGPVPPPRQARDLADLLARVRCLTRRLASTTADFERDADRPSGSTMEGSSP